MILLYIRLKLHVEPKVTTDCKVFQVLTASFLDRSRRTYEQIERCNGNMA